MTGTHNRIDFTDLCQPREIYLVSAPSFEPTTIYRFVSDQTLSLSIETFELTHDDFKKHYLGHHFLYRERPVSADTKVVSNSVLKDLITQLQEIRIPLLPNSGFGMDGTTYWLGIYSFKGLIEMSWWSDEWPGAESVFAFRDYLTATAQDIWNN